MFSGEEADVILETINMMKTSMSKSFNKSITKGNNTNYGTLYTTNKNNFNDSNKSRGSENESSKNNFYSPINYNYNYSYKSDSPNYNDNYFYNTENGTRLKELPEIQMFEQKDKRLIRLSKRH